MASTVLIRAAITEDEWTAFRKAALDERKSVKDLLADVIRQYLNGKEPK